jgi:glycine/D-amino acid oxidase-like deaminating enzyme
LLRPDAVVIGAGIIGASIAWRLRQAGLEVELVDAATLGAEASSASAGILAPGDDLAVASMALYPSFVAELFSASGRSIDYGICGSWTDGIFRPGDGYVDPRDLLAALRVVLLDGGVRLRENSPCHSIDTASAGAVILAAGAWSSEVKVHHRGSLLPLIRAVPVKGHLLGYQLAPGSLGPIRWSGHTYIVQRATGFTIAGSTEESAGFDRSVDSRICNDIHARASALWPKLASHTPDECWIGFRPDTETHQLQVGRVGDSNLWTAYGHYRNGILLAPVTAQRIATDVISNLGRG